MYESPSFIYAMTNNIHSPIGVDRKFALFKVGKANDIEKRRFTLSRPSGVAEEFRIDYAAMFPSEADAIAVERAVHLEAAKLNVHHREKREFIRSQTIVPIQLLIRQKAKELKIPIVEWFDGDILKAIEFFDSAPCLPHEVIAAASAPEKAMYFQGAKDVLCLIKNILGFGGIGSLSWSLGQISSDLTLNRDEREEFPSLQSTVVDHFRNNGSSETRQNANKFLTLLKLIDREETFSYRYEDEEYKFTGVDGILGFK